MQKHIKKPLLAAAIILVLVDEFFKSLSKNNLNSGEVFFQNPVLDLTFHKNYGIAFNIPFQREVIIATSFLIGAALLKIVYENYTQKPQIATSASIIIIGAAGNLFDRIYYGFTIDYILLFQKSIINLSDILIVGGVVWLLFAGRKKD